MKAMNQLKKVVILGLGFMSLGLGLIGIALPLLPTTPFLLLALFSFLHSSQRWHQWLMNHPVLGVYVRPYVEHRAISTKTRVMALVMLWSSILMSSLLFIDHVMVRFVIFAVAGIVSMHILQLKNIAAINSHEA